jgi:hypothetical protein
LPVALASLWVGIDIEKAKPTEAPRDTPRFTADGKLTFPQDYREWIFLSAGLGMTYGPAAEGQDEHPSFDNVFVNRPAYNSFLQSGQWPDRTIFVLEVRSSRQKGSINNGGHFQGDLAAVESEVKDQGKWKFFGFETSQAPVAAIPASASCYSCHAQHGAVDNTFVQFYPTLFKIAKQKGTLKASAE